MRSRIEFQSMIGVLDSPAPLSYPMLGIMFPNHLAIHFQTFLSASFFWHTIMSALPDSIGGGLPVSHVEACLEMQPYRSLIVRIDGRPYSVYANSFGVVYQFLQQD